MKPVVHFLNRFSFLFIALTLIVSACGLNDDDTKPLISGKGSDITLVRDADAFTGISLEMDADVFVQPGTETRVEVLAQQNLHPYVLTYVSGGKLVIKTKSNLQPTGKIKIFVTLPVLEKALVDGNGRIIGNGTFTTDELTAAVNGAGRIDLIVDAKEVNSHLDGIGTIYLAGEAVKYSSKVVGAGIIDSYNLITPETAAKKTFAKAL